MSEKLEWPATLPLPRVEAQGEPGHRTLTSPLRTFGGIHFRNTSARESGALSVGWTLTVSQLDEFEDFFLNELKNGVACFLLDLLLPSTTTLKTWVVRFLGDYSVSPVGDLSEVKATLALVEPELEEESQPAEPVGWEAFLVLTELDSSGASSGLPSSSAGGGAETFVLFEGGGLLMVKED